MYSYEYSSLPFFLEYLIYILLYIFQCAILLTFKLVWWSWGESNSWPPACKAGALANWATAPYNYINVLFKVHWKINKVFMPRASLWQLNVTLFVIYKTFILYIINNERVGFPIEEVCTSPTFRLTFSFSLERRWSSRTFWYGYLVTTSPQSLVLPSTAASIS